MSKDLKAAIKDAEFNFFADPPMEEQGARGPIRAHIHQSSSIQFSAPLAGTLCPGPWALGFHLKLEL